MANLTSGATSRSSSSSASFSSSDYYEESWSEFHERMQSAARARSAARMERTVDTIVGAIEARVAERDRAQRFHQQRAEFEGVAWWLASGNESGETFGESDEWNGADSKARPRKAERRRGLGKLMKWCGALKQTARKVKERLGDWREQRRFDRMSLSKLAGLIETGELRREDLVRQECWRVRGVESVVFV